MEILQQEALPLPPAWDAYDRALASPLNLSTTTSAALAELPGLTLRSARALLALVRSGLSLQAAADSLGLDPNQQEILRRTCFVGPEGVRDVGGAVRLRMARRADVVRGDLRGAFQPEALPADLSSLVELERGPWHVAAAAGVRRGETPDYAKVAGALWFRPDERLAIFAGDFFVRAGLGLTLANPFALRKGGHPHELLSEKSPLAPSRGLAATGSFRGLALTGSLQLDTAGTLLRLTAAYSAKPLHATLDGEDRITSFYPDGVFRTATERAKFGAARETSYVTALDYGSGGLQAGAAALVIQSDKEVVSTSKKAWQGYGATQASVWARVSFGTMSAAAELSASPRGAGVVGYLHDTVGVAAFTLSFRILPPEFRSPRGSALTDASEPGNERGAMLSFSSRRRGWALHGYFDVFDTPTRTYQVPAPRMGFDCLGEYSFGTAAAASSLRLRMRRGTDHGALLADGSRPPTIDRHTYSLRIQHRQRADDWEYTLRGDAIYTSSDRTPGWALTLRLRKEFGSWATAALQTAVHHTPSWESALWGSDLAVVGTMASAPLYGQGSRSSLRLTVAPSGSLTLSASATLIYRTGTPPPSDWNSPIRWPVSDISLQLDARL